MHRSIRSLATTTVVCLFFVSLPRAQSEVLHFDLDEGSGTTAIDSSGLGNDGTLVGPSYTSTGLTTHYPTGSALVFAGGLPTSDHVVVSDSPSLRPADVTVDAWVMQTASPGTQVIVGKQVRNGADSYVLYTGGGSLVFSIHNGASQINVLAPFPADGAWHHVAGTFEEGVGVSAYVDGCLVGAAAAGGSISYDSNPVTIGADKNGVAVFEGWIGTIDEVRIHDKALDWAEIGQLAFHPPLATYCTPGTSASGCQASLSATGAPSATAASGFVVSAAGVEAQKDGTFFFGTNGRKATSWGNGSSYKCVVPPVSRVGLLVGSGSIGQCNGTFSIDFNALWCPTCPKAHKNPGLGACVQAQLWYRDPFNTSNQTTSLSDAIEFVVGP